jgi:hypothetical protein
MSSELTDAKRIERMEGSKEKGFADFMAKAETKLLVSMVPPMENPDLMKTLLRAAFDAGHGSGQGNILVEMLTAMVKAPKDGPRF